MATNFIWNLKQSLVLKLSVCTCANLNIRDKMLKMMYENYIKFFTIDGKHLVTKIHK